MWESSNRSLLARSVRSAGKWKKPSPSLSIWVGRSSGDNREIFENRSRTFVFTETRVTRVSRSSVHGSFVVLHPVTQPACRGSVASATRRTLCRRGKFEQRGWSTIDILESIFAKQTARKARGKSPWKMVTRAYRQLGRIETRFLRVRSVTERKRTAFESCLSFESRCSLLARHLTLELSTKCKILEKLRGNCEE